MLAFPTFLAVCCTIGGLVHSISGAPLASAEISVRASAAGNAVRRAVTDARGTFSVAAPSGSYTVSASQKGFASLTVSIDATRDVDVEISLEPLDSPKLRQIGSVTVDGRLAPIAGTIPSVDVPRSQFDALGYDRVIEGLADLPGATFTRPDGGAASAIAVVSLRGPDPSESLVALDGQLLNDGNTGDLDLSRLPVAAFSAVDVTEGLGPEDSNGSNTFGGAINFVSLRPTKDPHTAASLSGGSFGQSESWVNATGTQGRFGYAAALDDQNEGGFVNQTVPLYTSGSPVETPLGSSVAARTLLGTATWSFSQNTDVTARAFVLGDRRDQSSALSGIDDDASDLGTPQYGHFIGPGEQTFAQDIRAYQIRARLPLGAGELTTDLSESDNNVAIDGGSGSPYDIDHVDHRYNAGLTWQRTFATSQLALGGYTRYESLGFGSAPQSLLGQTIDVLYARGGFQPIANLRLDGGVFESRYTTFGSNLDARFGAIYSLEPRTSLRFSLGTGFRAPLLLERYEAPYSQLMLDGNNVFVGQGSAGEHPEHATEYELGASHEFGSNGTLDVSLYQTNLRDPIEIFYPLAAVAAGTCTMNSYATPNPACVSYNSNVGNAVYQGAELRYSQRFAHYVVATARYGLNVAYPKDLNAQFSNPTSGGNLVDNAQFLGIAQQQGSLQLEYAADAWHAAASATARGKNNELGAGPFAFVNASVGRHVGSHVDLSLAGTNLFNAVAGPYTRFGAGTPYRGITGQDAAGNAVYGSLPTDAFYVEPAGFRLILTLRN